MTEDLFLVNTQKATKLVLDEYLKSRRFEPFVGKDLNELRNFVVTSEKKRLNVRSNLIYLLVKGENTDKRLSEEEYLKTLTSANSYLLAKPELKSRLVLDLREKPDSSKIENKLNWSNCSSEAENNFLDITADFGLLSSFSGRHRRYSDTPISQYISDSNRELEELKQQFIKEKQQNRQNIDKLSIEAEQATKLLEEGFAKEKEALVNSIRLEKQNIAIREQNLVEDRQRFEDSKQEFQLSSTDLKEWEKKLNKLQNQINSQEVRLDEKVNLLNIQSFGVREAVKMSKSLEIRWLCCGKDRFGQTEIPKSATNIHLLRQVQV